jgi:hypothetical protein
VVVELLHFDLYFSLISLLKNDAFNNYSIVACVFVAVVTLLPSRCLAMIRGYTYRHAD